MLRQLQGGMPEGETHSLVGVEVRWLGSQAWVVKRKASRFRDLSVVVGLTSGLSRER